MTGADGYNGWTNWDTWAVHLWITNDEAPYFAWRATARRLGDADALAETLKDELPTSGIVGDDVDYEEVNWLEVAEALLEE